MWTLSVCACVCDADNCLIHVTLNTRYDFWLHLFIRQFGIRICSSCNLNDLKLFSWFKTIKYLLMMSNPIEKFLMPYFFFIKMHNARIYRDGQSYVYLGRKFYVWEKKDGRSSPSPSKTGDEYPNRRRQIFCMPMMKLGTVNFITWNRVISDFVLFFLSLVCVSRCKHSLSGIFEEIEYLLRRNLFLFIHSFNCIGWTFAHTRYRWYLQLLSDASLILTVSHTKICER